MKCLRSAASAAFAALASASCATVPIPIENPVREASPAAPRAPAVQATEIAVETPRLYARDGSVVDGAPRGQVETRERLVHDLQPSGGGRMYILELYQQVMNERDDLQRELHQLEQERQRQNEQLTSAEERQVRLEERVTALEQEQRRLVEENLELAGRLTSAQIGRLEVERLLLQAKVREAKEAARDPVPAPPAAADRPPSSDSQ